MAQPRKTTTTFAFVPGQRVVLARVRHPEDVGKTGVIKKVIKTKKEAIVVLDNGEYEGETYRAYLENIDLVQD